MHFLIIKEMHEHIALVSQFLFILIFKKEFYLFVWEREIESEPTRENMNKGNGRGRTSFPTEQGAPWEA